MRTFLPYAIFAASAAVLDQRRLGKQRVEALQILRGLTVPGYGWHVRRFPHEPDDLPYVWPVE